MLKRLSTLAGVAQWIVRQPVNPKVAGSLPSQGTCLSCWPGPLMGACERQLDRCSSLPFSLKVNKTFKGGWGLSDPYGIDR